MITQPVKRSEDILRLSEYFQSINHRDYLLFLVGIYTANRISDLIDLKVSHFFKPDLKTVREHLILTEKKRDKKKTILIVEELHIPLKEHLEIYHLEYEDYLFFSFINRKRHIDRTMAWRILKRAGRRLNIEHFACHSLRKTFGYHFYKQYRDPFKLSKVLCHSNVKTSMIYSGIDQEEIDNSLHEFKIYQRR